jgi:hypothetical protein
LRLGSWQWTGSSGVMRLWTYTSETPPLKSLVELG